MLVDYDYIDVFALQIVQGRNFCKFPSDAGGAYLINESAEKILGWADPIGREFGDAGAGSDYFPLGKIIGVIKDFHLLSLRLPIAPLQVVLNPSQARNYISIKFRGTDIPTILTFVRETWKRFESRYPFEYFFLTRSSTGPTASSSAWRGCSAFSPGWLSSSPAWSSSGWPRSRPSRRPRKSASARSSARRHRASSHSYLANS